MNPIAYICIILVVLLSVQLISFDDHYTTTTFYVGDTVIVENPNTGIYHSYVNYVYTDELSQYICTVKCQSNIDPAILKVNLDGYKHGTGYIGYYKASNVSACTVESPETSYLNKTFIIILGIIVGLIGAFIRDILNRNCIKLETPDKPSIIRIIE